MRCNTVSLRIIYPGWDVEFGLSPKHFLTEPRRTGRHQWSVHFEKSSFYDKQNSHLSTLSGPFFSLPQVCCCTPTSKITVRSVVAAAAAAAAATKRMALRHDYASARKGVSMKVHNLNAVFAEEQANWGEIHLHELLCIAICCTRLQE